MNSVRRPAIITSRPQVRAPKVPKREPLGRCLVCGEAFLGPDAIRLRHGCIRQRKWGAEFIELPFDDRSKMQWICMHCGWEKSIIGDDGQFSPKLEGISADGQCCLCQQVIEPYPLGEWSSAIQVELGEMAASSRGQFYLFQARSVGHLHFFCMDDLDIELWRLIERSDVPDYREYLPCA